MRTIEFAKRTFTVTGVFVSSKPEYWSKESITRTVEAACPEDAIGIVNSEALEAGKLFLDARYSPRGS